MPHNFWKSLDYEGGRTKLADHFYSDSFKVEDIVRFDTGSSYDMEFQRQDIDVQLYGWGRVANVSEKFRDRDFNDLYLELYSMFPERKGWMNVEGADYLAYYFPLRMFWIKKAELKKIYRSQIEPIINRSEIESWIRANPKKSGKFESNIANTNVQIITAYNQVRNKTWNTVGVSVPFHLLKNLGLQWKEFRL